jgi:two-component system sensor histidine kinase MtrB
VGLRKTVATLTLLISIVALLIAGTLFWLTTALHRTTVVAAAAMDSVYSAKEAQLQLMRHAQASDPVVLRSIEDEIQDRLGHARVSVTTANQELILDEAQSCVTEYFSFVHDASRTTAERLHAHAVAYSALEEFTDTNVDHASAVRQTASRWDRLANGLAVGASVLLVSLTGILLGWLRTRAFEPILELAATMERFGRGELDARAGERGPRELREMCGRFNEMASAIASQRHAQMAFLGGVAHDLRNPLSTLQMAVALMLTDRSLSVDERIGAALERINRQIKRMDRMLGDFLDGARIEAGMLDLRVEIHDARAIVEEVVALFDGVSAKHAVTLRLEHTVVPILCDRLRIEQVLINLLSNAIKYSPSGGVVEVALRLGASELELSVTDHGVGISDASLVDLFVPFRRVGLSSAEAIPGVGLGLFIVRKIVDAHGGRIEVDSAEGSGSTFRVFLPLTGTI